VVILRVCWFLKCRLDRKRQRKVKNWDKYHLQYVNEFEQCVENASESGWGRQLVHDPLAFNNYLRWLHQNTRVELCRPAYGQEILEENFLEFDDLAQSQYNRDVRKGNQVPFSSIVNFVVKC